MVVGMLAITSLTFMFVWVPLPVCHTTRGKCSKSSPASISSQTAAMASPRRWSRRPRRTFTWAAAFFRMAKARSTSWGILSPPMGKFSTLRWVCAPQYLPAGTFTSPMVSCSMRYSILSSLPSLPPVQP